MDKILSQKLKTLEDEIIEVSHRARIDLTTETSHPRISYPYPYITPYKQVLGLDKGQSEEEIIEDYAEVICAYRGDILVNEPL